MKPSIADATPGFKRLESLVQRLRKEVRSLRRDLLEVALGQTPTKELRAVDSAIPIRPAYTQPLKNYEDSD